MFSFYRKKASAILLIILQLSFFLLIRAAYAEKQHFPFYPAISENVAFWEKVYARYPNDTIIVHDREDVQKIYTIIPLPQPNNEDERQQNLRIEKEVQKKYKKILLTLATHPPRTVEEKRIAAFFTGANKKQQLIHAAEQMRTQNGMQQRFRQGVIRSGAYLAQFKKIFRSYNLPEDLAYLPHVESSFHIGAYSKAGACGIWQFTKNTGKRYLIIDDAVDQRLDPIAATHAAAKYFRRSYHHLHNWPLAITSYNYGLPGTIRALKEFGNYSKIFQNHRTQAFQFASRNFYAEFLAARKTAKKLARKLPLQKPSRISSMRLDGYVNLKDIAYYFHISNKQLKQLNPALLPAVFSHKKRITKGYILHLPQTKNIQSRIAKFPKRLYYRNQQTALRYHYHRARKGETLSSIAARFNVTVNSLRKTNKLGNSSLIKENQKIRIPGNTKKEVGSSRKYERKSQKIKKLRRTKSKKTL